MAKSKKLFTPIHNYPASKSRLMIVDWGSLAYHQLWAIPSALSYMAKEANGSGMERTQLVIDTAEKEVEVWKSNMIDKMINYIRLFNPLDVLIALEGKNTWRHVIYNKYYRENNKITYDKTGYYVSYDNDIVKITKSGSEITIEKLKDKENIPIKEIEFDKLSDTVKDAVIKALPEYKGNRKKKEWPFLMSKSTFNNIRNTFAAEVSKIIRAHVIQHDNAEGDDIIYATTKHLIHKYDSMVLITRDSDMNQLLGQKNLVIYNHMEGIIQECMDPSSYLQIKILSGDSSDNISGILLPGKSKKVGEAGAQKLFESIGRDCYGTAEKEGWLKQYIRNQHLIDLSLVPEPIYKGICDSIDSSNPQFCAFWDIQKMGFKKKIIDEIAQMKESGLYTMSKLEDIKKSPEKFDVLQISKSRKVEAPDSVFGDSRGFNPNLSSAENIF